MALSFPSSPSVGQTSSQNGRQYTWSGYAWELSGTNITSHASLNIGTGDFTAECWCYGQDQTKSVCRYPGGTSFTPSTTAFATG